MDAEQPSEDHTVALDPRACRSARLSRDPRFDGEFFLGVKTTGIYCRPTCPARAPAEHNVSYFRSTAQAAQAGFRPCLRCRPESAPGSPAWQGSSTTVQRALGLIHAGALNSGSLTELAQRLGVGERYLRKLFQRELGISPHAVALNQRLLFAKKLLAETSLPMTDVAYAAGFGSLRRFNSAVSEHFRLTPGQLRSPGKKATKDAGITLQLQYRPPYDWPGVIDFFQRHAVAGVEAVSPDCYQRNIRAGSGPASFQVTHLPSRRALQVELTLPDPGHLMPVVANIRRMFDLDANPQAIADTLKRDATLASLLQQFPGIRAPVSWSLFESAVRAIVGQQVSVAAARGVSSRLANAAARPGTAILFPDARSLASLDDSQFPMPGRRRETLQTLCRDFTDREDALDLTTLGSYRGVGPWTVAMVAMRGAGAPDVFPRGDLGLERAWQGLNLQSRESLYSNADSWRPWRSYAANLLWRSLSL